MDTIMLLEVADHWIAVKKKLTIHANADPTIVAFTKFGNWKVTRYYYGSLVI